MLSALLAPKAAPAPMTVDDAVAGLTVALDNLAAVAAEKRQEAADFAAQAATFNDLSKAASDEGDRAERIHGNIKTLLA